MESRLTVACDEAGCGQFVGGASLRQRVRLNDDEIACAGRHDVSRDGPVVERTGLPRQGEERGAFAGHDGPFTSGSEGLRDAVAPDAGHAPADMQHHVAQLDQTVCSFAHGDRSFGVVAQCQTGNTKIGRLLL